MPSPMLLLLLLAAGQRTAEGSDCSSSGFAAAWLPDCVSHRFLRIITDVTDLLSCSLICWQSSLCKAFTFNASTGCRLMEFNACSFGLLRSACSDRALVFVRRLPGVQAASLCPTAYVAPVAASWSGRTYRKTAGSDSPVTVGNECDNDDGVSKFADLEDAEEAQVMKDALSLGNGEFWVSAKRIGAHQPNATNWQWSSCGNAVDTALWDSGQPNNDPAEQPYGLVKNSKLADRKVSENENGICECLDPFRGN